MLYTFFAACLLIVTAVYADVANSHNWSITKDSFPLSCTAVFNVKKTDAPGAKVVRSGLFTPRYYYDLCDENGNLLVRGITRAFSLGMLVAWATEIDLYDENRWIGMIKGEIWTTSRAKFSFYDGASQLMASAHLDDESCNFLIVSAQDQGQVLAELIGKSYGDASFWEMKFHSYPPTVDERALHIFAGFVSDFQKWFVRRPKVVNQYYFYNDVHYNRQN